MSITNQVDIRFLRSQESSSHTVKRSRLSIPASTAGEAYRELPPERNDNAATLRRET
ncbi:MAG TPA: hypothetical protein VJ023_08075 [Pyrinomonadaceae bacterium]|nr:hypothetical protein [Pyrinomonadaceae bacterium]